MKPRKPVLYSQEPVQSHVVQEIPPPARTAAKGIVRQYLAAATGHVAGKELHSSHLIGMLKVGLPIHEVDDLRQSLDLSMDRLGPMLGLSKATWHRRQQSGKLDPAESDRVVRYARLVGRAVEVLESEENARVWLSAPQFGLGGAVPLEYAQTEVGCREVEDLLGRIEHSVYS